MSDRWGSAADSGVESTLAALGIIRLIAGCHCESKGMDGLVYSSLNCAQPAVSHQKIKLPRLP